MVFGIANSPQFSGRYVDSTGKRHGFAIIGSIIIDLFYPEGAQTLAYRIGNDGMVTGSYIGSDFKRHGFVTGKISIPDRHNIVYTPVD
ncbi:MAG: hypothetical protein GY808_04165 [Gammaproteobacteria bacterium]|nr:hypothetical protein [Gammaproteobacteria bacterium]